MTGPGGGGIAGIEGGYQFYGGGAERSLEVIMHGKFVFVYFVYSCQSTLLNPHAVSGKEFGHNM